MNIEELKFNLSFGFGEIPKDEQELKQSHHLFLDSIVYGGDKTEFHKIIDNNSIPEKGSKGYKKGIPRRKNIRCISYFYNILEQYREVDPSLIFVLDWKEGVEELRANIEQALAGTECNPTLPLSSRYPANASILHGMDGRDPSSVSTVFKDYALALAQCNIYLVFIESYGDEYVLYLHRLGDGSGWTKTGMFFRMLTFYKS